MISKQLSKELNIKPQQSEAVIKLIDDGNTIPFIARYRKEATGSLDDTVLRKFNERLNYLRNLESRKETIIESIKEQGKLTSTLKDSINKALTLVELEDLYLPYKKKRATRASKARDKGLGPLSEIILDQDIKEPVENIAKDFLNDKVKTIKDAIKGAMNIIAEDIAENAKFRKRIRDDTYKNGDISIKAKDENVESEYEMYYDYDESIYDITPHRILAINRGEKEGILKIKIDTDDDEIKQYIANHTIKPNKYTDEIIEDSIDDSYKRLIKPAIERDIRSILKEEAEDKSIKVFSKNLEQLLLTSPIENKTVLGWDPAFRTGCKIAIVDPTGKVLDHCVIYPTEPQNKVKESKETISKLIRKYNVDLIALGNGTASRESEQIIADMIKEYNLNCQYVIVSEAGASVYSASKLADKEFPDYDVGARSAISIARRLQDPLAELVKIDPKSIGVGQYQHDMNQKKLNESLSDVVEKVVNDVGVNLNTASPALLSYVSGISNTVAGNIVKYREENGEFSSRKELKKVKKLGPKTFEQCAGFTKVPNSKNPLDNTTVHPESYKATEKLLKQLGYSLEDIGREDLKLDNLDYKELSSELGIGEITLKDIVKELKKPGRDPRDEMPEPILRNDVLEMKDLKEGMILKGTVRNVVDFGAFVDIGVHQDGLVHISELVEDQFVKHPLDIVSVGDIVDVRVLSVDLNRNRINLSMII
ncbi:Tex family protein [Methanobrevibacter boviskoreani]|uniref:Tex family protein n=1 Tax=Methanobrevibacter boviskoreani TaxID=1348249 RepID=UPI002A90D3CF|nr:Tex family protein [Methanobrevibacter boviskoreani]MDY5614628.1 Tex family protein [Methanobrevibacter boviskoreani]